MPTVLRMRGFLACKLSFRLLCQNRCTVRREQMPHKACKGHWEFRYNYNFIWQPAQIHIHVQLHLAGTSLYQRCLVADEILSAPNKPIHVSAGSEPCNVSVKHWKDCIYRKKENICLRTSAFQRLKQMPSNKSLSYKNFFPPITYDTLYFNCLIQPEGIKILLLHRKREYPF